MQSYNSNSSPTKKLCQNGRVELLGTSEKRRPPAPGVLNPLRPTRVLARGAGERGLVGEKKLWRAVRCVCIGTACRRELHRKVRMHVGTACRRVCIGTACICIGA